MISWQLTWRLSAINFIFIRFRNVELRLLGTSGACWEPDRPPDYQHHHSTRARTVRARRQVRNLHRGTISQYAANKVSQARQVRETQLSPAQIFSPSCLAFNTSELSDGLSCEGFPYMYVPILPMELPDHIAALTRPLCLNWREI